MDTESRKSLSWWWSSYVSPENSTWLAENFEEVDQSVKQMLQLIEQDGDSSTANTEAYLQKKPELIALVEEFKCRYRLLAERYDQLTGELFKNIQPLIEMQNSGSPVSGSYSSKLSPDQKHRMKKAAQEVVGFELCLSSGGGSTDVSFKEGSESSSLLSSDSDSESLNFMSKQSNSPVNVGDRVLQQRFVALETKLPSMEEKDQLTKQDNSDAALEVDIKGDYEILLGKITKYNEELRISSQKLQFSREEIARLKDELEKKETIIVLMGNLQAQLESAQSEVKVQEADLELEQRRGLELQKQIAELQNQVSESAWKIQTMEEELDRTREKLKCSEEEIAGLKHSLTNEIFEVTQGFQGDLESTQKDIVMLGSKLESEERKVLELQERILKYVADLSDRDQEIRELHAAQENFYMEKAQLQSDIHNLSEKQTFLEARIKELESQNKISEHEIRQFEVEKMQMKALHEGQEISWQSDITRLKAELTEKGQTVEALNKDLDMLKLKYDMLMAEKDGINANLQTICAELSSRNDQIQQMQAHLRQLHLEHVELVAESESAVEFTHELRLKVEELEKEVDSQRVVISDRAEEKREAIRQLCFSLEHYRSGYEELRQAYIGYKRHAVLAS